MERAFRPDDLMAILDGIDDAVVKLDGQAHFLAMNQAADQSGSGAMDLIGRNDFRCAHEGPERMEPSRGERY